MVQSQGDHSGQKQVEPEHTDQHQGQGTEAKAPTGPLKWNPELEVFQWGLSPHWSPQRVGGPSPHVAPGLWVPSRALLLGTPGSWTSGAFPGQGARDEASRVHSPPWRCPRGQKEWETWEPGKGAKEKRRR